LGTAFLIAPGLAVTCWHVVADAVEQGKRIAVVGRSSDRKYHGVELEEIGRDEEGRDLASARVRLTPQQSWSLATTALSPGADVLTFGYPLTQEPNERRPTFSLESRYLEGYVTRTFYFDDPKFGRTPSYELDMRAPAGLSGAPLIRKGSREIVGVVFGRHGVETIETFGSRDPETGKREPDVVQVEHFALGHYTSTLLEHSSSATAGRTLQELLTGGN
jgi:hypothetical protein